MPLSKQLVHHFVKEVSIVLPRLIWCAELLYKRFHPKNNRLKTILDNLSDRIHRTTLPIAFIRSKHLREEVLGISKEMSIVLSFAPLFIGSMVYYSKQFCLDGQNRKMVIASFFLSTHVQRGTYLCLTNYTVWQSQFTESMVMVIPINFPSISRLFSTSGTNHFSKWRVRANSLRASMVFVILDNQQEVNHYTH